MAFARYEESEILSWAGPRVGLDVFGDEKISYEKGSNSAASSSKRSMGVIMGRGEFARYEEVPKFCTVALLMVYWLAYVPCVLYFRCVSGSIPIRVTNFN